MQTSINDWLGLRKCISLRGRVILQEVKFLNSQSPKLQEAKANKLNLEPALLLNLGLTFEPIINDVKMI